MINVKSQTRNISTNEGTTENVRKAVKFNFGFEVIFEKVNNPAQISEPPVYLYTKQMELHDGMDIERLFHEAVNDLSEKIKKYELVGSCEI